MVYIKLISNHNLEEKNANAKKLEVNEGFRREREVEMGQRIQQRLKVKMLKEMDLY